MKFSGILGVLSVLTVFLLAIFDSSHSKEIFLNTHAIVIVIGGTLAATILCFPVSMLFNLVKVFFQKVLGRYSQAHETVIKEIVDLARGYREDEFYLKNNLDQIKTHFLRDAIDLMVKGGIKPKVIDEILYKRSLTHSKRYEEEAGVFKVVGKFPPAFGLMGTTLGMIGLLQSIGNADAFKKLGPSMAVALVATFYGIALANLIFVPLGEHLSQLNREDEVLRQIVMDGVRQLRLKEHPVVVEEHLKSYLLPKERDRFDKNHKVA